jgi:hypothetical protein
MLTSAGQPGPPGRFGAHIHHAVQVELRLAASNLVVSLRMDRLGMCTAIFILGANADKKPIAFTRPYGWKQYSQFYQLNCNALVFLALMEVYFPRSLHLETPVFVSRRNMAWKVLYTTTEHSFCSCCQQGALNIWEFAVMTFTFVFIHVLSTTA